MLFLKNIDFMNIETILINYYTLFKRTRLCEDRVLIFAYIIVEMSEAICVNHLFYGLLRAILSLELILKSIIALAKTHKSKSV